MIRHPVRRLVICLVAWIVACTAGPLLAQPVGTSYWSSDSTLLLRWRGDSSTQFDRVSCLAPTHAWSPWQSYGFVSQRGPYFAWLMRDEPWGWSPVPYWSERYWAAPWRGHAGYGSPYSWSRFDDRWSYSPYRWGGYERPAGWVCWPTDRLNRSPYLPPGVVVVPRTLRPWPLITRPIVIYQGPWVRDPHNMLDLSSSDQTNYRLATPVSPTKFSSTGRLTSHSSTLRVQSGNPGVALTTGTAATVTKITSTRIDPVLQRQTTRRQLLLTAQPDKSKLPAPDTSAQGRKSQPPLTQPQPAPTKPQTPQSAKNKTDELFKPFAPRPALEISAPLPSPRVRPLMTPQRSANPDPPALPAAAPLPKGEPDRAAGLTPSPQPTRPESKPRSTSKSPTRIVLAVPMPIVGPSKPGQDKAEASSSDRAAKSRSSDAANSTSRPSSGAGQPSASDSQDRQSQSRRTAKSKR